MSRMSGWRRAALALAIAALLFRLGLGFGQAVALTAQLGDRAPLPPLVLCTPRGVVSVELRSETPRPALPTETTLCPVCLAACTLMAAVVPVPIAPPAVAPAQHPAPDPTVEQLATRISDSGFHPRAPPVLRDRSDS